MSLEDVLIKLYKFYVRPHLDYGDIIYHKYDPSMPLDLTNKLEQIQYAAALAVTGAWKVQVETNCTKSSGGKLCMIGDGPEGCAIFQTKKTLISTLSVY